MVLAASARIVVLIVGGTAILYFGRPLLVPLAIAAVLAMVLNPLLNWLMDRGVGRLWAIAICVLVLVGFTLLITGLIALQIGQVAQDWPRIEQSLLALQQRGETVIAETFGMSPDAVTTRAQQLLRDFSGGAARFFGSFLSGLVLIVLTIAYIVLMLAERDRFVRFVTGLVPAGRKRDAEAAMGEMADIAYSYLTGKVKVMGIMAAVYATAFLIGGVPYAVFLALLIAMSSIVPYVGNFVGGVLAVVLAFVSSGGTTAIVVLAVLVLAQIGENYFLEPLVVGKNIDLSPFVTVLAIVALGTVWGVVGAVLALPLTAMVRVILAHVPRAAPLASVMKPDE